MEFDFYNHLDEAQVKSIAHVGCDCETAPCSESLLVNKHVHNLTGVEEILDEKRFLLSYDSLDMSARSVATHAQGTKVHKYISLFLNKQVAFKFVSSSYLDQFA